MLLVYKILNNSAAIARDEKNNEYLVLGKGVVFNKGMYDEIDPDMIMRVFTLGNEHKRTELEAMVSEIPYEFFEVSECIKNMAEKELNCTLDAGVLLRLADHIHYAKIKLEKNIHTPNLILQEIRQFYRKEFEIGKTAIRLIDEKLHTHFDENEIGFIAFHIISSEEQGNSVDMDQMIMVLQKIVGMVEDYFHVCLEVDTIEYARLVTHLKFFILRIFNCNQDRAKSLKGDSLYDMLTAGYPDISSFLDELNAMTLLNYSFRLSDTDRMYLLIHLARVLKQK